LVCVLIFPKLTRFPRCDLVSLCRHRLPGPLLNSQGVAVSHSVYWLGYGLDDRGSILSRGWFSYAFHCVSMGSVPYLASYPMGTGGSFPGWGIKQPGREADHPPPSSAEVKNVCSYTSTHPIRLHSLVLN
jgi:hypothetical protein